jgi:DNA-binding NarL/FixJ family response regulator
MVGRVPEREGLASAASDGALASVLVVDDHEVVRVGLAAALADDPRLRVVGLAGSAREALAAIRRRHVDVAVVDLRLPDMPGTELCRRLCEAQPGCRVVVLSSYLSEDVVRAAIEAGAAAYVAKGAGLGVLREAVEEALAGRRHADGPIHSQLRELVARRQATGLTPQQERVLELAAEGLTYGEIGARLFITESTVRFHVQKLKQRFRARSKTDLIAKAIRSGAIAPADDDVASR